MTLNIVSHVALNTGIIFTKFELTSTYPFWLTDVLLPIRHVTLRPWPLTL